MVRVGALRLLVRVNWRFGEEQEMFTIVRRNGEVPVVPLEFAY